MGDIIIEYKETVDSDCTLPILTSSKTEGVILQEEHFGRKQQHDITGYNILPRNYCTYRNRSDGVDFTFNINKCCDKGIISKFYPVFSGKNSDVFFLSLVLNNSDEVVREIAYTCTGTGQKVLSFWDLQKMKVRAPRFNEQKEIAAYFESLDHLITLHQRKRIDLLKEGKNDWEQRKLGEVYNFQYGEFNNNPDNGGEYPIYGANGIIGGYTKYNAEDSAIIGHMGAYAGYVVWASGKHFVTYNGTIAKPFDDLLDSKFGYYILSQKQIYRICAGSGQPFVSYADLKGIDIEIPIDKSEQEKIGTYFSNLDQLITLHQQK